MTFKVNTKPNSRQSLKSRPMTHHISVLIAFATAKGMQGIARFPVVIERDHRVNLRDVVQGLVNRWASDPKWIRVNLLKAEGMPEAAVELVHGTATILACDYYESKTDDFDFPFVTVGLPPALRCRRAA